MDKVKLKMLMSDDVLQLGTCFIYVVYVHYDMHYIKKLALFL